jgi:hypothetical protein
VANLPPVINDTGGKFDAGVNYTSGKFATGINDTGGKFATGTAGVLVTDGMWEKLSTVLSADNHIMFIVHCCIWQSLKLTERSFVGKHLSSSL